VLRGMAKPLSEPLVAKLQAAALELLCAADEEVSRAASSLVGALGKWVDLAVLLDAVDEAAESDGGESEEWQRQLRVVRAHQSLLRTLPAHTLAPVLPAMFTPLGVSARTDKIDVRQPAAHALARLAASMATPPPEAIAETEAEGGSLEELAQATSAAVPPALHELLVALLNDKVMEVRISAIHAVKTLCKLGGPLLRAADCRLGCMLVAPIVNLGCQDGRHLQVKSAAQRTLVHLTYVCGWNDGTLLAPLARFDRSAAEYVVNFVKPNGTMRRLAALESEAEYSDVDL